MADAVLREQIAKLPIWTGESTDVFTARQWLNRIESVRQTAGWAAADVMQFVYTCFRGEALHWWEALKRSKVNTQDYELFKVAFLTSFAEATTARTASVSLHDVKQTASETIVAFYARVIKLVDNIELLLPAAKRLPPTAAYPAEIQALAGFAALAADIKTGGLTFNVNVGLQTALDHVGLQIFIAGLRPNIRDELMKTPPGELWQAFEQALALESIYKAPKSAFASVHSINLTSEQDLESQEAVDLEIDAVQAHLSKLKFKKSSYSGQAKSWSKGGTSQTDKKDIICRSCKKKGHMQDVCRSRIRDGKPMLDAQGNPMKRKAVNEVEAQQPNPMTGGQGGGGQQSQANSFPQGYNQPPPHQNGFWVPSTPNFQ